VSVSGELAPSGLTPVAGSVNPSNVILNHWTNGDPNFTAGPPTSDVVMKGEQYAVPYARPLTHVSRSKKRYHLLPERKGNGIWVHKGDRL
jgi:hypothetical protein